MSLAVIYIPYINYNIFNNNLITNVQIFNHFSVFQFFSVLSPANSEILMKMKEELRREHGEENCPWTDLEIEGIYILFYFQNTIQGFT